MQVIEIALIILVSISLLLSVLSISLVFAWRHTSPETADLRTSMNGLRLDQATIVDKFTHYMQREDARVARLGKKKRKHEDDDYDEEQAKPAAVPLTLTQQKLALRQRLIGARST